MINWGGRELIRRTNEKQDFRVRLDLAGVWERVNSILREASEQ